MPLWDSVQRGLEKASQEAARIAKMQRLRSNIDGLARQINTQNAAILNKTMDLFVAGQLTQSELLPLCQEMINLQQQLNQAQNELKQLQAQANQLQPGSPQTQTGAPNPYLPPTSTSYPSTGEGLAPPPYAPPPPPDYQTYIASTHATGIPDVPPPPPGVEPLTVSSIETIQMNMAASPVTETRICSVCQAELLPNHAFCHNCGAPVQADNPPHLPTMRGGYMSTSTNTEETLRASAEPKPGDSLPSPNASQSPIDTASSQGAIHNEGV